MHPALRSRVLVVADPGLLLTVGAFEGLAIGLTVGLSVSYLTLAASLLTGSPVYSAPLAALLLSLPAIGALVAGLWRMTLRALATRSALPTGAAPAVGLWAGLLLGEVLMRPFRAPWPIAFLADPALGSIDAVGLLLGCLLFARWTVGTAAAWLPAARGLSLRPALIMAQLIGAVAFGGALGVWLSTLQGSPGFRFLVPFQLLAVLTGPYTLVPILLATVLPLAAALRRAAAPAQRALWLGTPDMTDLPTPRLRLGVVLIPALVSRAVNSL